MRCFPYYYSHNAKIYARATGYLKFMKKEEEPQNEEV